MSELPVTIPNAPALEPAEDFYRLRREGIGFIEQMGSRLWTDYNLHDPGITLLEALCYAITDLAYRSGWEVKDLLTSEGAPADPAHPFPDQAFFSAREILTVNPVTPKDLRRLLIDLDAVRNAWVFCKECACEASYYAFCDNNRLTLSYLPPADRETPAKTVWPLGLYEALLELEADPFLGDMNDRKIEIRSATHDAQGSYGVIAELRFPEVALANGAQWELFLDSDDAFAGRSGASFTLTLTRFGATRDYDVFSDPLLDEEGRDEYLRAHWRGVFYASYSLEIEPGAQTILLENAALRLFGSSSARNAASAAEMKTLLSQAGPDGFVQRYRAKAKRKAAALESAKAAISSHRNLCEDYCRVDTIGIEEVAVCAEVEVAPEADIERVQAWMWYEIEQYLNPPIPFYSLQELLDSGVPVEEAFNGPALASGFIKKEDLEAAELKSVLRVSDIINRLMDIEGVVAVKQLQLAKYDAEGNLVKGSADPTWTGDGKPVFDRAKGSASWLMFMSPQHQPRLYQNASCFLFFKNGLPFQPRMDEALDTLTQLRGQGERPKLKGAPDDLPVPLGTFRKPQDYFPVQYSLPATYGVGPAGLPSYVSRERRARAKQLKGYLMVFEQLLGNALAQLAHLKDLFSLDGSVERSYFVRQFDQKTIDGYDQITSGLNVAALENMTETLPEFLERRNRFLDHLLARFGEDFKEYALLLTNLEGEQTALDRLIGDKISFLAAYPLVSHDRARGADYRAASCTQWNQPGIKKRISLLMGYPDLAFSWRVTTPLSGEGFQESYLLEDRLGRARFLMEPVAALEPLLKDFLGTLPQKEGTYSVACLGKSFAVRVTGGDGALLDSYSVEAAANQQTAALSAELEKAYRGALLRMVHPDAYVMEDDSGKVALKLVDQAENPLGRHAELFASAGEAAAARDELLAWSANERLIVVEHLLLRPKFPGDALYPACSEGSCVVCGDEDPYSFRVSFVMPGWTAPFNSNMQMRGFADRTIREETPAHLLPKVCWVGNDGFTEKEHEPTICALTQLLLDKGTLSAGGTPADTEASSCAVAVFKAFNDRFRSWYEDKVLIPVAPDALKAQVETELAQVDRTELQCPIALTDALWEEISKMMVQHFLELALHGWQFERFEDAWCRWLNADAAFDWTREALQARVEAVLAENVLASLERAVSFCRCAATIVGSYAVQFQTAVAEAAKNGRCADMSDLPPVTLDLPHACRGMEFKEGTEEKLKALLEERYASYREVSCRLALVVKLLSELENTYPPATLHDFDEGNDRNPVRLGQTSLGS